MHVEVAEQGLAQRRIVQAGRAVLGVAHHPVCGRRISNRCIFSRRFAFPMKIGLRVAAATADDKTGNPEDCR